MADAVEMQEVLARLHAAAVKVPLLESPYPLTAPLFGPPCCQGELDELRAAFPSPTALPSDYLEYLSLCRRIDAMDVFNGYALYSPLRLSTRDTDVPSRLHVGSGPALEEVRVLTIGSDGGGNQFLVGTTEPWRGHVWKWNHEAVVRFDGVADKGLSLLATSFTNFLERMAVDWEHFVQSDRTWQYFSG